MMTAIDQELLGDSNKELIQIIKGKRTKRQRPTSPVTNLSTNSSCFNDQPEVNDTNTSTLESMDQRNQEEEEDMANCLMLLSQATSARDHSNKLSKPEEAVSDLKYQKKPVVVTSITSSGLNFYECKTCNKSFPSFQALGGHRASHKKPKMEETKSIVIEEMGNHQNDSTGTALSLKININGISNKIHECSICGAEFSSGQALGGHMRRHRSSFSGSVTAKTTTTTSSSCLTAMSRSPDRSLESKKSRNVLELDLNLPAPQDDITLTREESKFQLGLRDNNVIVFSASPLVDCHH